MGLHGLYQRQGFWGLALFIWTAAASPVLAADKVSLQLRWDHQFQFAGYYAALWQGYYAEAGLDVDIRSAILPSRKRLNSIKEVSEGRADFGIGSVDSLVARDQGAPLVLVADIFQQSAGGVFARKETGVSSPADLVRLKVRRMENDLTDVELQAMLRAEGIDPATVGGQLGGHGFTMLRDGQIDAYAGYTFSALWRSRQIGMEITVLRPSTYGVDFYGDGLFVNERLLNDNPDLVERFTAASLKGWEYALEHPEETIGRIVNDLPRTLPVEDIEGFNRFQSEEVRKLTLFPIVKLGHMNMDRWRRIYIELKTAKLVTGAGDLDAFIYDPVRREEERQALHRNFLLIGIGIAGIFALGFFSINRVLRRRVAARTSELNSAKALLEKTFSSLDEAVFVVDAGTREIIACNNAVERILGYKESEIAGKNTAFLHVDENAYKEFAEMFFPALDAGGVFHTEFRMRRKDGTEFPTDHTVTEIRNEAGERTQIVSVVRDITERKRSEMALQQAHNELEFRVEERTKELGESEKRLAEAQRIAHLGSWEVNLRTGKAIWSDERYRIFGYKPGEIEPKLENWKKSLHPEDRDRVMKEVEDALSVCKPYNTESRIIRPNGEERIIQMLGEPVLGDDGTVQSMAGTVLDITERKKADDELRKLSSVVEQSPSMMFITDTEGVIEYANAKFYEVTGYAPEEVIGQNPRIIKSGNMPQAVYEELWKTIKAGKVWQGEIEDRCKDGRTFWAHVTIAPIRLQNDIITHYFSAHENISMRKEAENEMRDAKEHAMVANRAKSDLLANMSHELRTPLNAIIGFSSTMKSETFGPLGEKYMEYANDINISGEHLLELINDILDVSAIEAGKLELGEEELDVGNVVEATLRMVKERATEGNIHLIDNTDDGLPRLHADKRRLMQILLNLLSNAVKFTPPDGEVEITASLDDGDAHGFTVRDTGVGMDEIEIAKAMSKFGQVDSGLDRKHEGTGLGLPLTQGLVELHGGTLEIKSEKGKGTTATVRFPPERTMAS